MGELKRFYKFISVKLYTIGAKVSHLQIICIILNVFIYVRGYLSIYSITIKNEEQKDESIKQKNITKKQISIISKICCNGKFNQLFCK